MDEPIVKRHEPPIVDRLRAGSKIASIQFDELMESIFVEDLRPHRHKYSNKNVEPLVIRVFDRRLGVHEALTLAMALFDAVKIIDDELGKGV